VSHCASTLAPANATIALSANDDKKRRTEEREERPDGRELSRPSVESVIW